MTPPTFTESELNAFSIPARTAYRLAHPDRYRQWKLAEGRARVARWEASPANMKRKARRNARWREAQRAANPPPKRICACGCGAEIPAEAKHNRLWAGEGCRVILKKRWTERHAGERALSSVLDTAVRQGKPWYPTNLPKPHQAAPNGQPEDKKQPSVKSLGAGSRVTSTLSESEGVGRIINKVALDPVLYFRGEKVVKVMPVENKPLPGCCFTCETNPPLPGKNICFDCLRDFLKEKNS